MSALDPENLSPDVFDIVDAVRAEFRAGGKPLAKYQELGASEALHPGAAAALSSAIIRSLEDRICRLETARDW